MRIHNIESILDTLRCPCSMTSFLKVYEKSGSNLLSNGIPDALIYFFIDWSMQAKNAHVIIEEGLNGFRTNS